MREKSIKAGVMTDDMTFNERVWTLTARIPAGKVVTYGQIAHALDTRAYRAVGNALNRNPYAPVVPCHRVVGGDGNLTGFASGIDKKRRMLEAEGIAFRGDRVQVSDCRHEF